MSRIKLLHARIDRLGVTHARRDQPDGLVIDAALLDRVGLLPLQEVEVVGMDNGLRWRTHVLPGERGSGQVIASGAASLMCRPGHLLQVCAYEERSRAEIQAEGHVARVLHASADNRCERLELLTTGSSSGDYTVTTMQELGGARREGGRGEGYAS